MNALHVLLGETGNIWLGLAVFMLEPPEMTRKRPRPGQPGNRKVLNFLSFWLLRCMQHDLHILSPDDLGDFSRIL